MAEKKMIIDGVSCRSRPSAMCWRSPATTASTSPRFATVKTCPSTAAAALCLVENDRGKMDAACSMQPRDGMVVNTHTKQVLDSRRTTLQLLMSSHRPTA